MLTFFFRTGLYTYSQIWNLGRIYHNSLTGFPIQSVDGLAVVVPPTRGLYMRRLRELTA